MKLEELKPGERFSFNWCPERTGEVLHVGESGVMIKEDKGSKTVRIVKKAKWGSKQKDKVCEFVAPAKPVLISGAVEVTRIGEESDAA